LGFSIFVFQFQISYYLTNKSVSTTLNITALVSVHSVSDVSGPNMFRLPFKIKNLI